MEAQNLNGNAEITFLCVFLRQISKMAKIYYDYTISQDLVVVILMSVILGSFYIWLTAATFQSTVISENNQIRVEAEFECSLGQCPVDLETGEKLYDPADPNKLYKFNPATQRCTSLASCDVSPMIFAINSDGSTNSLGECEFDPITRKQTFCRCSSKPFCSYYTASYFQTTEGNPFQSIDNSRTTFSEIGRKENDLYGVEYDNPNNTFCEIPVNWLFRVEGSSCSNFSYNDDPFTAVKQCIESQPCGNGTVAFLTDNPDGFSKEDLARFPVACVRSQCLTPGSNFCSTTGTCAENAAVGEMNVPIFDLRAEMLLCKSI